jgi:tRNA/tmRNA/rRNA uracil-C5-methylase (TrmA/RlmC/RlmD family)
MAMVYVVREITRGGRPSGRFRMTSASDESENAVILGLCEHEHVDRIEARSCPVVVAKLEKVFPPMTECPKCNDAQKLIVRLERGQEELANGGKVLMLQAMRIRQALTDVAEEGVDTEEIAKRVRRERDEALKRIANLEFAIRKIHNRAHGWSTIIPYDVIEQVADEALGLKKGE